MLVKFYEPKRNLLLWILAVVFAVTVTCTYCLIFYRQLNGSLNSDLLGHLNLLAVGLDQTVHRLFHYSVYFFSLCFQFDTNQAALVTLMVYSLSSAVVLYLFLKIYLNRLVPNSVIAILTVSLMVVSGAWIPWVHQNIYLGVGTPNVFHNPTTIAAKPFAFMSILLFYKALIHPSFKTASLFSIGAAIFIILSAFAKPNFALAFVFAAPIFIGFQGAIKSIDRTRFFILLISVLSSALVLLIQFLLKYSDGDSSSSTIVIDFLSIASKYNEQPFVGLLMFAAFPVGTAIMYPSIFKEKLFQIITLIFIVSVIQYFMFAEAGPRMLDGNFGWGRQITVPILYAVTLGYAVREMIIKRHIFLNFKIPLLVLIYIWHVVSGFLYIKQLIRGSSYW